MTQRPQQPTRGPFLEIRDAVLDGRHVVAPVGELDLATAARLDATLEAAERQAGEELTLDLSGVTFMDCCGLHSVLAATETGRVRLVQGSGQVQRLFALVGSLGVQPLSRLTVSSLEL